MNISGWIYYAYYTWNLTWTILLKSHFSLSFPGEIEKCVSINTKEMQRKNLNVPLHVKKVFKYFEEIYQGELGGDHYSALGLYWNHIKDTRSILQSMICDRERKQLSRGSKKIHQIPFDVRLLAPPLTSSSPAGVGELGQQTIILREADTIVAWRPLNIPR